MPKYAVLDKDTIKKSDNEVFYPVKCPFGKLYNVINIRRGAILLAKQSCEISSVPVMISIFESANSFLTRSLRSPIND